MKINNKIDRNILVGADPELFIVDNDGDIVPAYLLVEGTKEFPFPITDKGHCVQYDNVMLEYNIPPSKTYEEFIKNNHIVLQYAKDKICEPHNYRLDILASKHVSKEYLSNPIANTFGCDPDYNAYTGEANVFTRASKTLRSCGGHLHISYEGMTQESAIKLIQLLDLYISVPLVLIEPDSERKQLYGKAGAYRIKQLKNGAFIVEYRSPSNFWLTSDRMMQFVFEQIHAAIEYLEDWGGEVTNPNDVIEAINTGNKEKASELLDDYNIKIPAELMPVNDTEAVQMNFEDNDSLGG